MQNLTFRVSYVYIMASVNKTLYVGVTTDLQRRVSEHRRARRPSFTGQYKINQLVYFEQFTDLRKAIAREKQVKSWGRAKKVALIEAVNPHWRDLSEEGK